MIGLITIASMVGAWCFSFLDSVWITEREFTIGESKAHALPLMHHHCIALIVCDALAFSIVFENRTVGSVISLLE
jgi:hypothetical protein